MHFPHLRPILGGSYQPHLPIQTLCATARPPSLLRFLQLLHRYSDSSSCNRFNMNRSWHFQLRKHRRKYGFVTDGDSDLTTTKPLASSTMDPTTLVTFLFRAPPEAHTVELFGSWDNFQQPYRMHHDRRRGRGFWSGCFTFHDIVFDGEKLDWSRPRSGGLKQGGTYWYFYRLNDDAEAYDDSQTYTTTCPLLPGQRLNIIEVPMEIQDLPSRCCSASGVGAEELARVSSCQTLDPDDKFLPLDPPPMSKVHGRCISDLAINGRLENRPHSSKVRKLSPSASQFKRPDSPLDRCGRPCGSLGLDADSMPATRSSVGTAGSWSSKPPSFAHSSIVDVQARAFSDVGTDDRDLSPAHKVSSPMAKGLTSVPYEEDVAPKFSNPDPFVGFDGDQTAFDDDFDVFFQLPSTSSDRDDRPSSSRGSKPFHAKGKQRPTISRTDSHIGSRRPSFPVEKSRSSHGRDLYDDLAAYDVLSPSFSAATMSSAGLSTPFRLSAGCSRTASVHTPDLDRQESTINRVTAKLRRLQSSYSENVTGSPPLYESADPSFSGYSLPSADKTRHGLDLSKTLHAAPDVSIVSHRLAPLASWNMPETEQESRGNSFADNVFSELSFFS